MQEVEAVCDRVILIHKGKIVADKNLQELKSNEQQEIIVEFDFKIEQQFINKLPNLVSAKNVYDTTWMLTFNNSEDMRPKVFDFAQENGLKTLKLDTRTQGLENLFKELTT
jgi:ABC-2 type transport system ATP-binding protein